jgi:hypothetical protein
VRFSSKYAERVAAKHPVTLDKRFIQPKPEKEGGLINSVPSTPSPA